MKKLFLLPAIALFAIMALNVVSASTICCQTGASSCSLFEFYGSESCLDHGWSGCRSELQAQCPEFTTIGAGIAVLGAGLGYALIRKKRK